ncbi:MAG: hypothetical protein KAV18_04875 [Candidatus Omnitrophica bacterium]|nr:hypothetical protein [Candidatus Omnitrophota bacterium]MCK4423386.1 hypothetical protein [Candidatus Omnitrophota bacterium]
MNKKAPNKKGKKHLVRRVSRSKGQIKNSSKNVKALNGLPPGLLDDLRQMIKKTQHQVATAVNVALVMLNWNLGKRIWREIMGEKRAAYGRQIVDAVSRQLTLEYGSGYSRANIFHMIRFIQTFPDEKIVYALSRQLSWTHFK